MGNAEIIFQNIIESIPSATEGKIFGARCIKSKNGKTAAIFWKDEMLFKLTENDLEDALKLPGAKIGSHLYAPEKPMNGWLSLSHEMNIKWKNYTIKAIEFVEK